MKIWGIRITAWPAGTIVHQSQPLKLSIDLLLSTYNFTNRQLHHFPATKLLSTYTPAAKWLRLISY